MNRYEKITKTDTDLIPKDGSLTGSYLCTWWMQSPAATALGLSGEGLSEWRDALCTEGLFSREDLFHPMERENRSGIIFLLDDGWDLPKSGGTPISNDHYGAVDPDPEKFKEFGNTPTERLSAMNRAVRDMGYAGLGLWISPQKCKTGPDATLSDREYWEKRAGWCHEAGILYWKVDWGEQDFDDDYRALISDCARRLAPGMLVEHAVVQKPCTHHHGDDFPAHREARARRQMSFADVYRTYDVLEPFDKVCTLMRAHEALLAGADERGTGRGLINGENIYGIVSALGLTAGIMNYTTEARACVRWQRLAPPFGIYEADYNYSDEQLCDFLFFASEICGWAPCKGRTVREYAPAVMSRGCPLPVVSPTGEHAPFVVASKNPKTRAFSVATVTRSIDPVREAYFPADVTVTDACIDAPVGVFGVFNSLTVEFDSPIPEGARVLTQDLCDSFAYDATALVTIEGNRITLDGKDLRYLSKVSRGHNDRSEPSLIIKISY